MSLERTTRVAEPPPATSGENLLDGQSGADGPVCRLHRKLAREVRDFLSEVATQDERQRVNRGVGASRT